MSLVLDTTRYVVENASDVAIETERVKEFAKNFYHEKLSHWLSAAPFDFGKLNDNQKLEFLLVFNSISFSYWGKPKWTINHKGKESDGSWAMISSIGRALDEGRAVLDTKFREQIPKKEFADILRGNVEIPLLEERWKITREIAATLQKKYGGQFSNIIQAGNSDAMQLLDIIVSEFPSFQDVEEYNGKKVYFYKRAQLLVADIFQLFAGKKYGKLSNIEQLTACADYKLPQALRAFGILQYSEELSQQVDNQIEIPRNSRQEIEIRANTIWAVEYIRQEIEKLGQKVSAIGINDHLWLLTQTKIKNSKPYHLTRTTAY